MVSSLTFLYERQVFFQLGNRGLQTNASPRRDVLLFTAAWPTLKLISINLLEPLRRSTGSPALSGRSSFGSPAPGRRWQTVFRVRPRGSARSAFPSVLFGVSSQNQQRFFRVSCFWTWLVFGSHCHRGPVFEVRARIVRMAGEGGAWGGRATVKWTGRVTSRPHSHSHTPHFGLVKHR